MEMKLPKINHAVQVPIGRQHLILVEQLTEIQVIIITQMNGMLDQINVMMLMLGGKLIFQVVILLAE